MHDRPFKRSESIVSRTVVRAFLAAAALLAAVVIVSAILTAALTRLAHVATAPGTPADGAGPTGRMVMAAIYAVLGLVVVGGGVLLVSGRSIRSDRLATPDVLTAGAVTAGVLFVVAFNLLSSIDRAVPPFVLDLVSPAVMGGLAVGYCRYRDTPIETAIPSAGTRRTVLGVGLVAVATGTGHVVLATAARSPVFGWFVQPRVGVVAVLRSVIVVGVAGGLGWGLLYNVAIQQRLTSAAQSAGAVAAVTALVGIRNWARPELGLLVASGSRPPSALPSGPTIAASLAAIAVATAAAWLAIRAIETVDRPYSVTPVQAGIAVVAVLTAAVFLVGVVRGYATGFIWSVGSLSAVAAAASAGYERTRSVWVPALAFGAYWLLVDSAVTDLLVDFLA